MEINVITETTYRVKLTEEQAELYLFLCSKLPEGSCHIDVLDAMVDMGLLSEDYLGEARIVDSTICAEEDY